MWEVDGLVLVALAPGGIGGSTSSPLPAGGGGGGG